MPTQPPKPEPAYRETVHRYQYRMSLISALTRLQRTLRDAYLAAVTGSPALALIERMEADLAVARREAEGLDGLAAEPAA